MKRQSKVEEALSRQAKTLTLSLLHDEQTVGNLQAMIRAKRDMVRGLEDEVERLKNARERASVERRPRG